MNGFPFRRARWRGPSLMLQILALLLGGLVVAQLVTLALTLLLPPAPSPQHSLAAVAAALRGEADAEDRADRLDRVVQAGPPDVAGPGWLISDRSKRDLAALLGADPMAVRLAFYTPLPFAGTAPSPRAALKANDGFVPPLEGARDVRPASLLILAQMRVPPGGLMGGAIQPPSRDSFPPGVTPEGGRARNMPGGFPSTPPSFARIAPLVTIAPGMWIPGDGGAAVPPLLRGGSTATGSTAGATGAVAERAAEAGARIAPQPFDPQGAQGIRPLDPGGRFDAPSPAMLMPPALLAPYRAPAFQPAPAIAIPREAAPIVPAPVPQVTPRAVPTLPIPYAQPPAEFAPTIVGPPDDISAGATESFADEPAIPLPPRAGGLFGIAPAPFVEGEFVAAMRLGDGRWAVVRPAAAPFPNAWQRRVLLWFAIAFAIVAPIGWLFARRVVKPLTGFAEAAERLGRDPAAGVTDLDGPAEVGRAARAFKLMQSRLKSFVDDRTAMVGAISHDLRTPLTRLRFRAEEVEDDAVREGIVGEIEEMEAMITSVLAFIRDASAQASRERLDLRAILEDVVEDAAMVGGDVTVEAAEAAPVEVDVLGMRRLLANLVENAVKYGDRARVRLSVDEEEAVAEIVDDGPGVPEHDLERAFEPFYRAADARASDKRGSGLGLAVCRSIARAHGGDVRLVRAPGGFTAQLRVPLAYGRTPVLAG